MSYKKGTFGYWWTVKQGKEDIKGKVYDETINCSKNKLISLEGAPEKIKGSFWCFDNNLTSLEGAPKEVQGDFLCTNNKLTSLEGAPKEVKGDFWCTNNNLVTLKGAPEKIGGYFTCENNKLLKDASDIFKTDIKKYFKCDIMTDEEYKYGRDLYLKLKDLDKVKKIYKLKAKMR